MNTNGSSSLALLLVCSGCLGTWREYIVTTEDVALVNAPSPPMSVGRPADPGGIAFTGGLSLNGATGWAGLPTSAHNVGHMVPVGQLEGHVGWHVARPLELGFGLRATSFRMSEPASAWLREEHLDGAVSTELGPTLRFHIPLGAKMSLGLQTETRVVFGHVSRYRTVVTVMEYEDGPMEGRLYVHDRSRGHHDASTPLGRQLVAASLQHRLAPGWDLDWGAALQTHPVFEASYELHETCYGGDDCYAPKSLDPTCHAVMATPWVGVGAPVGDHQLRTGVFGSFALEPHTCAYPETVGLTFAAVARTQPRR
jgi:hypothetical protein